MGNYFLYQSPAGLFFIKNIPADDVFRQVVVRFYFDTPAFSAGLQAIFSKDRDIDSCTGQNSRFFLQMGTFLFFFSESSTSPTFFIRESIFGAQPAPGEQKKLFTTAPFQSVLKFGQVCR